MRCRRLLRTLIVAALGSLANIATAAQPPRFFIDRGACPFECCTYGTWRAKSEVALYSAPRRDAKRIASVAQGSSVRGLTGEVHIAPGRLLVQKDVPDFKAGEVLWIYTYLGEGHYKVWRNGRMAQKEIDLSPDNPQPDDWGTWEGRPQSTWWAKIRTKAGTVGWTNTPTNFDGIDSCA